MLFVSFEHADRRHFLDVPAAGRAYRNSLLRIGERTPPYLSAKIETINCGITRARAAPRTHLCKRAAPLTETWRDMDGRTHLDISIHSSQNAQLRARTAARLHIMTVAHAPYRYR